MKKKKIIIDNKEYLIQVFNKTKKQGTILAIVSFIPNDNANKILEACIKTIKKFTLENYELWIVDNNSPERYKNWLKNIRDINLILNFTSYSLGGSYENGVGLDIIKKQINNETKYLMTLHMDTLVCRYGWLKSLISEIRNKVVAIGVRMDKGRDSKGIPHVLGCLYEFAKIKRNDYSFLPKLPRYDTGDLISNKLRKAGYKLLAKWLYKIYRIDWCDSLMIVAKN
jgi:glycosyltransferase involved in cell wall biosynthesis